MIGTLLGSEESRSQVNDMQRKNVPGWGWQRGVTTLGGCILVLRTLCKGTLLGYALEVPVCWVLRDTFLIQLQLETAVLSYEGHSVVCYVHMENGHTRSRKSDVEMMSLQVKQHSFCLFTVAVCLCKSSRIRVAIDGGKRSRLVMSTTPWFPLMLLISSYG